jgi:hypothetical protein
MTDTDDAVTVELTLPTEISDALEALHDRQHKSKKERLASGRGRRGWDTEALSDATERDLDAKLCHLLVDQNRDEARIREAVASLRD